MLPNPMAGSRSFPFPQPQFPQNGKMADEFLSKALQAAAEYICEYYETPHPSEKKTRTLLCRQVSQVSFSGKSQVHTTDDSLLQGLA